MAFVFGEMRTLNTSERWWWSPKCTSDRFPGIAVRRKMRRDACDHCWWVPVSFIVSRPTHHIPPVSCTRLSTQSEWPMHALFVTTHHITHCLALTLSRSTRSHTVSLYRVLTLIHVRFRTSWYMVSSSVNVSHRLALFRIHLIVCRATGQFYIEPRTVRRTNQRTGSAHCCCSNCCCTHTVLPTTAALLMHHTYTAHRSSHQPLLH